MKARQVLETLTENDIEAGARHEHKQALGQAHKNALKDPYIAYDYARYVLCKRWPEAEPLIATSTVWAFEYACNVIGGRFLEGEEAIKKDPLRWHKYIDMVVNGSHLEH